MSNFFEFFLYRIRVTKPFFKFKKLLSVFFIITHNYLCLFPNRSQKLKIYRFFEILPKSGKNAGKF